MAYATAQQFDYRFPALANREDTAAELDAATDWIDGYCHRTFALETSATDRYFAPPAYSYTLDLGPYEIGSTSGLVIALDDGTNTYGSTLSSANYVLEPVNAPNDVPSARPYTCVRRLDGLWPYPSTQSERQERVKITARYGWPSVPPAVTRACMLLVVNAYENASGVKSETIDGYSVTYMSGTGQELGVPALVLGMLNPYVRGWAA